MRSGHKLALAALLAAVGSFASPAEAAPRYGNCYWDGTRPFCAGSCRPGFKRIRKEGSGCITGSRAYCCEPMGFISQPIRR